MISEKKRLYNRVYNSTEKRKTYMKKWYANNAVLVREYSKKYYDANPSKCREKQKLNRIKFKDYYKAYWKKYRKERYAINPVARLSDILRSRISAAIKYKRKSGSAVKDLGCSLEQLFSHLESKFEAGMTWENWGKWHIDHIRPLISFDLTNREQFLQACHYTNLQPLWAKDNIAKGARLDFVIAPVHTVKQLLSLPCGDTAQPESKETADVRTVAAPRT